MAIVASFGVNDDWRPNKRLNNIYLLPSREVAVQVQVLAVAGDPLQRLDLVVHPHHAVAVPHRAHRRLQVG